MPQTLTWRMEQEQPCTLEQFLRIEKNVSRRLLTKLKRTNGLWCNGTPIRSIDLVRFGDVIELRLPEVPSVVANAVRSVPICFETADFVVYHKPPDLPVHPSQNHYTDTLGNCFCAAYPGLACRPVNRLDRKWFVCICEECLCSESAAISPAKAILCGGGRGADGFGNGFCSDCTGTGVDYYSLCAGRWKTSRDALSGIAAQ